MNPEVSARNSEPVTRDSGLIVGLEGRSPAGPRRIITTENAENCLSNARVYGAAIFLMSTPLSTASLLFPANPGPANEWVFAMTSNDMGIVVSAVGL